MTLLDDDLHNEKEQSKVTEETQLAQLQELSATDQADTTFSGDTSVPKETSGLPEPTGNQDQMWKEYNEWKEIGKSPNPRMNLLRTGSIWVDDPVLTEQREQAKMNWYFKYYGMSPEDHDALKKEQKEKYNNYSLGGFSDTIRNLLI